MKQTRIEKVVVALSAISSFLVSGASLVSLSWLLLFPTSPVFVRPAFGQSSGAGVQLEAGIAKEEADGDLKSAMDVYQKIATDVSAPRDVRAKALLRLAGCYEKLGRQAKQLYEQIVRDYADQPAATQARSRLATLKQQEHPAAPTTMAVRKIEWSAVGQMHAGQTDGQRGVYRGSDGNLYFGDLAGHTKRLVLKAQSSDALDGWVVSRDFSMVVLRFSPKPNHPAILAVVRTDGAGYRELIRDDALGNWSADWSWDSRSLVVCSDNLEKGDGPFVRGLRGGWPAARII